MKTLNLFLGFAFVIFGYSALMVIPELRNYIGQETLAWFLFYSISFCLTFIAWALSYAYIKEGENPLNNICKYNKPRKKMAVDITEHLKGKRSCPMDKQMELKL